MNIVLLEAADREMNAAAERYESSRMGLGAEFLLEIDHALALLQRQRHIGKVAFDSTGRFREFSLGRFPYRLVYEIARDEVVILAVGHHSRRPGYWLNRVQDQPAAYSMAA